MTDFERQLRSLIDTHQMESDANTPAFVLASYLQGCLTAFNAAVARRDAWYGAQKRLLEAGVRE